MQVPSHTRFVVKNGPTSVGKGFEEKLEKRSFAGLIAAGLNLQFVSFGQIIRDKLASDAHFNRLHGKTVSKGDLLPDEAAIEIFREATALIFNQGEPDLVFVDGFCRSTPQISFAADNGFLDERDHVFFMEASIETCLERFLARVGKSDTKRNDHELETFYRRYHLHRDTVSSLRGMLLEMNGSPQIVEVDANLAIAEFVHPTMLQTLLPLAFRQMAARNAVLA